MSKKPSVGANCPRVFPFATAHRRYLFVCTHSQIHFASGKPYVISWKSAPAQQCVSFAGNYWTLNPAFENMFEKGNYRRRRRMKRPGPYRTPVGLSKTYLSDSCTLNQLLGPKYDQGYASQAYGNYGSYFSTPSAYSSWPPSLSGHSAAAAAAASAPGLAGTGLSTGLSPLNSYAASCRMGSYYSQMPSFTGQTGYTPSQVTLPDLNPSLSPSISGMSGPTLGSSTPGSGGSSAAFSFTGCRQQDTAPTMPPYPYWSDRQQL